MDLTTRTTFFGAAGTGGDAYWIARLGDSMNDFSYKVLSAADGNIYALGNNDFTGSNTKGAFVAKYTKDGEFLWAKRPVTNDGGFSGSPIYGGALDASGNIYLGSRDTAIFKYNSSGSVLSQVELTGLGRVNGILSAAPNGNIYIAHSGDQNVYVIALNSSLNLLWVRARRNGGAAFSVSEDSIGSDSASNVYICGNIRLSGTYYQYLAKYDSSGNFQWQRSLTSSPYGTHLAVAADGTCYVAGYPVISKYDASGTLLWQRSLSNGYPSKIIVLPDGGLLAGGFNIDFTSVGFARIDSSGNIVWARRIRTPSGNIRSDLDRPGLAVSGDSIYVSFSGNPGNISFGGSDHFLAKLPADGSLTGTYGASSEFIYESLSLTLSNASGTSSDPGATSVAPGTPVISSVNRDSSWSPSTAITTIP